MSWTAPVVIAGFAVPRMFPCARRGTEDPPLPNVEIESQPETAHSTWRTIRLSEIGFSAHNLRELEPADAASHLRISDPGHGYGKRGRACYRAIPFASLA